MSPVGVRIDGGHTREPQGGRMHPSTPDPSLLLSRDTRRLGDRLYTRARRGELVAVRPGVYAPAHWWAGLAPHERYQERVRAALTVFPDAVLFRESATVLHGLPLFGEPSHIHLFDANARATSTFGDVVVHASLRARSVVSIEGAFATGLLETIVDTARALPPAYALALVDAALRRGVSLEDLRATAGADSNRRGRKKLAWVFDFADARAESVGESVSRAVIDWLGFPAPVLQQEFRGEGDLDRTDFWWPAYRIIGESDGYGKYEAHSAREAVSNIVAEKKREDRLRRQSRGFACWDWADSHRAVPVRSKLLAAGLPLIGPPNNAMLATLRSASR